MKKSKRNIIKIEEEIQKIVSEYNDELGSKLYIYNKEENTFTILLNLNNFDIYQLTSDETLINDEIFNHIDKVWQLKKDRNADVIIKIIYKENTSDEEKEKIKKLIKLHYGIEYKKYDSNIKKTNITAIICLFIGAIILTIYALVKYFYPDDIFVEIIDIFAWVFIWETCDLLAFQNTSDRREKLKQLKLFNAQIIE